jgi:hypothetical protein
MRIFVRVVFAGLVLLQASAAFADCVRPRPTFSIPEGGSASEQDFTAANSALADFGSKVRDYLNCMNGEMSQKAVGKDAAAREQLNKAHAAAYNESANELRGLAACYKTQREIFKSTGGGGKAKPADCSSYIASAATQVGGGGGTPMTTELTIESSGHTFELPGGGKWLYYLARDIRSRRCSGQEATEDCLYRAVHVRNDSDEVLECKGEIAYVGTDSRGQKTAAGQLLASGRGTYVLVESLA